MLTCRPTRLRTLTDSDPAYANLRLKSAPNKTGYPSNLPEQQAGASRRDHTGNSHLLLCQVGRIDYTRTASNPHTSTALAA